MTLNFEPLFISSPKTRLKKAQRRVCGTHLAEFSLKPFSQAASANMSKARARFSADYCAYAYS